MPEHDKCFVGRKKVLEDLRKKLPPGKGNTIALTGISGIGKTSIAIEYAEKFKDRYSCVIWIQAGGIESIESGCRKFFSTILPYLEKPHLEFLSGGIIDRFRVWLEQSSDWLLIIDDVHLLGPWKGEAIPVRHRGSVLCTSANQKFDIVGDWVEEIKPFSPGESLDFYRKRCWSEASSRRISKEEKKEWSEFALEIGHLPLGLDLAFSGLPKIFTLNEFLEEFRKNKKLRGEGEGVISAAWSLQYEKMEKTYPLSIELLRLCAFMEADNIPFDFIKKAISLGELKTANRGLNSVLNPLMECSFLKPTKRKNKGKAIFEMHCFLQRVVRYDLEENNLDIEYLERAIRVLDHLFLVSDGKDPVLVEILLLHAQRVFKLLSQLKQEKAESLCADVRERAWWWREWLPSLGLFPENLEWIRSLRERRALKFYVVPRRICLGANSTLAFDFFFRGKRAFANKDWRRAQSFFEVSLDLLRFLKLHKTEAAVPVLLGFARCLRERTYHSVDNSEAENTGNQIKNILQTALEIQTRPNSSPIETIAIYREIARIHILEGEIKEARKQYLEMLRVLETSRSLELPDKNDLISEIVENLHGGSPLKEPPEAQEELFARVIRLKETFFGNDSDEVRKSLLDQARFCLDRGQDEKATSILNRALYITETLFGYEHPECLDILPQLAELEEKRRDYAGAAAFYARILQIRRTLPDSEPQSLRADVMNLAAIRWRNNDLEDAASLFEEILSLENTSEKASGRNLKPIFLFLGSVHESLGNSEKARTCFNRFRAFPQEDELPENDLTVEGLHTLAGVCESLGLEEAALLWREKALEIGERVFGENHAPIVKLKHGLAGLLEDLGYWSRARACYEEALEICRVEFGAGHEITDRVERDFSDLRRRLRESPEEAH